MLAHYNLPMPGAAYAVTLLVEIGVAIAFLIGWKGKATALVLAVWCVATALVPTATWAMRVN
jgi:putative oxidoreductase